MFSSLKPTFGTSTNNTTFGISNATPNPFAQPTFGKPPGTGFPNTTSTFGSPNAPFGSTTQHGTSLFGQGTQTASFGQPTSNQPAFGSTMFGTSAAQPAATSLFGNPNQSSFGQQNKSAGFGFGSSTTNFFGQQNNTAQPQQSNTGLFGQNTNNLFGTNQGFGSAAPGAPTGTVIKFTLVTGTDTMVKGNINQNISTRHHCITCMKEYEGKSLEELRWEDYQANRKGPQQGSQPTGGLFGGMTQPVGSGLFGSGSIATSSTPLFGQTENKSVFGSTAPNGGFGQTSTAFGGNAATSSSGLFGKPLGGFGTNTSTTSAFAFNPAAPTPLFGSPAVSKPFGTTTQTGNLFGQQPTGFGAQNSFGSFGTSTNQNVPLFSQKSNMSFNMGTTSGTGFGTGAGFNQAGTPSTGTLFTGVKPNQSFGGFGVASSAAPIFGQSSFAQPAQLFSSSFNKPTTNFFGQTNTNPGTNLSLGTGTSLFGNNMPKTGNLFGQNPGMYNTSFGNSALNNSFIMTGNVATQTGTVSTNTNPSNTEQQIISMSLSPFGLSSHLNDVTDGKQSLQDLSRPTNPTELKQLLNTVSKPHITSPVDKLQPKQIFGRKVPIFDGLEQRDEPVTNFRINNPNPKRLVLRNNKDKYKIVDDENELVNPNKSRTGNDNSLFDSDFECMNNSAIASTRIAQNNSVNSTFASDNASPTKKKLNLSKNNSTWQGTNTGTLGLNVDGENAENNPDKYEDAEQFLEASDQPEDITFDMMQKDVTDTSKNFSAVDDSYLQSDAKEPHPTGIILTRPEYFTKPTLDELVKNIAEDGSCIVKGFTIGRIGYGNVRFSEAFDVSNLNLDELVHFRDKEINIYPDESKKPPLGQGLNRKAQVTLDKVWPYNKKLKTVVRDIDTLVKMDYADRLRRLCEKQNTRFVEYRPDTGSWVFKVEHFSKYGHRDSDDSDTDESNGNQKEKTVPPTEEGKTLAKPVGQAGLVASRMKPLEVTYGVDSAKMSTDNLSMNTQDMYNQDSYTPADTSIMISKYNIMKSTFFQDSQDKDSYMMYYGGESDSENSNVTDGNLFLNNYSSIMDKPEGIKSTGLEELNFTKCTSDWEVVVAPVEDEDINLAIYADIYPDIENLPYTEPNFYVDSIYDKVAYRGRSFKVGWGRDFTLITPSCKGIIDDDMDSNPTSDKTFSPIVNHIKIAHNSVNENVNFTNILDKQLQCQLENSKYTLVNDIPLFETIPGYGLLESNKKLMQDILVHCKDSSTKYNSIVWNLCNALWGNIDGHDMYDFDKTTIKKKLLGEWLKDIVQESVDECLRPRQENSVADDMFRILTLISGNMLEEAAKYSLDCKNPHLSLFLSQLPCPGNIRMYLVQQLSLWQESNKKQIVDINVMKLYMLLAGKPAMKFDDEIINVCESMNWIRSFAVYFWYICPTAEPISQVLSTYEEAFNVYLCAAKPTTLYDESLYDVYDFIFHLMKYYCDVKYPLDVVLNPINYTSDKLDYSLSWFILQAFSSLNLNSASKGVQEHLCITFAAHLENIDMWHWSIFVLLFIEDPNLKKYYITSIISRHVELLSTTPDYKNREEIIVKQFHIPSQWIDSAKANKALNTENYREAVYYLSYSNRHSEMHKALFEHVVPDHFICRDYKYLRSMIEPLKNIEHELDNWNGTGEFILNLTELNTIYNDTLTTLVSKDKFKYIQHFRSLITNLSSQFENFPEVTFLHNICLAEISSRILEMIRILFNLPKFKEDQTLFENPKLTCSSRDTLIKELISTIDKYAFNFNLENTMR